MRDAQLTLFGSPPTVARIAVTPRPRAKRMARALTTLAITLVLAALAGIVPPHVPWILVVLALGAWRARAEWRGEYVLHGFEGACPRCGASLALDERYVTPPLTVPCFGCHAQPQLHLESASAD